MKKQLLSALVCLSMVFTLLPAITITAQAANAGDAFTEANSDGVNIKYTVLTDTSTVEVSANAYSGTVNIPASVSDGTNTFAVTSIGDSAFANCVNLTSVTIPDSVTSIGDSAFRSCSDLTSVTIPDYVTSIGDGAFKYCKDLINIFVSDKNAKYTSVSDVLFSKDKTLLIQYPIGKKATAYEIPNSVAVIGASAFECCESLTSVTIPNSVISIGKDAFSACGNMISVTIPYGVTSIGEGAFSECVDMTSVTIPDSVTSIGTSAFYACYDLTSVTIPYGVTSIGEYTFYDCKRLTSMTILDSITDIGVKAFFSCEKLTSVYFDRASPPTIGANAFDTGTTTSLYCNKSYAGNYTGGTYTFMGCDTYPVTVVTTNGTVTPSTVNGMAGETISLIITPATNYYFVSASYSDGTTTTPIIGKSFTMPNSAITLTAVFDTYTVTFDNNGGSGVSPSTANTKNGGTVALPATNPTRSGYTFSGWNTSTDGKGTVFTAATPVHGDINVYAVWTADVYHITYNLDVGVNNIGNPDTYTYGTGVILKDPVRLGYSFGGWYTDTSFSPGSKVASITVNQTGDIILYAKWTANAASCSPTYYTITASAGKGGSISPPGSNSVEYNSNVTYTITTDKGFKINDVLVDGVSVGAVSAYTFKNVSTAHTISASFKTLNPFADVVKNDWFYDNVMCVYENGLMIGTGSATFSPNGEMTRAMIVAVLHRMSGDKGCNTTSFSDVPSGSWYETAAAWAAANGIAGGVGGNHFAPDKSLTREQLIIMLYNYAKYKGLDVSVGKNTNISSYLDATDISEYAYAALQWACGAGIIKGDGIGNLNPQSSATRAEVAAVFQRFIKSNAPV